jgi:hypothetical protein
VYHIAALVDGFFKLLDLVLELALGNVKFLDLVEVAFGLGPFALVGFNIG